MPNKDRLEQPPTQYDNDMNWSLKNWFNSIYERLGNFPFKVPGYSKVDLQTGPTPLKYPAADHGNSTVAGAFSSVVFCEDATGGATLVFSDGTDWRRVQDRAVLT